MVLVHAGEQAICAPELDGDLHLYRGVLSGACAAGSCEPKSEAVLLLQTVNKLFSWWTEAEYDYYGEWMTELVDQIGKTKETVLLSCNAEGLGRCYENEYGRWIACHRIL